MLVAVIVVRYQVLRQIRHTFRRVPLISKNLHRSWRLAHEKLIVKDFGITLFS
jgi:hypothetical protein